ncbi:MAG: competence/damage-inducible protein A [Alicyclobacillus herbarius]|uniref:competence/damage-inducible protein A n=1 Tax=Alicyclobacillus herbarius TaxID=122960 RepID=UPI0023533015|nr:competence/damage-inducible protein A [Alicyclobacillus herbarius]MCL6632741.1 competence/damage-inducible protein A [Alicyclobacillus herbarius]
MQVEDVCRAEHIAVGSEILLGQIANGHAQTISQTLAEQGFFLFYHTAVGDNQERLMQVFQQAAKRSNTVIVTGGLGPTEDDLTKEALAASLGRRLILSESALREIESYFHGRGRPMPESNRKQALCIEGGELIPNPNGTAPGQYIFADGVHYFLLPGPPLEMKPMLTNSVIPKLHTIFSNRRLIRSRVLHFCGIGESDVDMQIRDLLHKSNPTVAPLAGEGEMLLRISAAAESESVADALIKPIEEEIRRRFADYIYGTDEETLPSAVGRRLRESGWTLALAESCTGGLISSMITAVPGSSAYFQGGVVAYQNEVKQAALGVQEETLRRYGAVSEPTAAEMARGVQTRLGATIGAAVSGIAGPSGGTPEKPVGTVCAAIAGPDGVSTWTMHLRGSREQIRVRAAKRVLWEVYRRIGEKPAGA